MKIKTFEAACKRQKLDPDKVIPDFSLLPSHHQKAMVAVCKLFILAEEWNAGWKPNWQDNNEWKYYPWFDMEKDKNNPSGFRLRTASVLLYVFVCRLPPLLPGSENSRGIWKAVH
jgi:hypothetical protein